MFFKHFRDGHLRLIDIVHLDALPVWNGLVRVDEVEVESCRHDVTPRLVFGAPDMEF